MHSTITVTLQQKKDVCTGIKIYTIKLLKTKTKVIVIVNNHTKKNYLYSITYNYLTTHMLVNVILV
jgi:predicted aspartyl protease